MTRANNVYQRLEAIGIKTYVPRDGAQAEEAAHMPDKTPKKTKETTMPTKPAVNDGASDGASGGASESEWKTLAAEVAQCEQCVLHKTRTQTVFGVGDRRAKWMFIGEGPGADEDAKGEPFVGRAGQLLTRMILAIGFKREQVYIANIVKCRPPDNRNPRPEEITSCIGYLRRQIKLVQPQIIVCLGGVAAQTILNSESTIGRLRGRVYQYDNGEMPEIPLVVTYHPAYLLRSPTQKKATWDDLKLACQTVGHQIPKQSTP